MRTRNHRTNSGLKGNKKTDITSGKRYGILSIVREVEPRVGNGWKKRRVECLCDCGNLKEIVLESLQVGDHASCGCVKKERARNFKLSHGQATGMKTPAYRAWVNMWSRVQGMRPIWKERYTDRGITVCERWERFENFFEDVGDKPSDPTLSFDRIDNDGNYEPGNVRWATKLEQSNNTCRTIKLSYMGRTLSVSEWALELGVDRKTLNQRRKSGWSIERILTTPCKK